MLSHPAPSTHPACDCLEGVAVYVSSPGIGSSNSAGQTANFWLLILSRLNLYDLAACLELQSWCCFCVLGMPDPAQPALQHRHHCLVSGTAAQHTSICMPWCLLHSHLDWPQWPEVSPYGLCTLSHLVVHSSSHTVAAQPLPRIGHFCSASVT